MSLTITEDWTTAFTMEVKKKKKITLYRIKTKRAKRKEI